MRDIDGSLPKEALRLSGHSIAIDTRRAILQKNMLLKAMQSCNLIIQALTSDGFADSVFIEDTAVVIGDTVAITNPGALSRKRETESVLNFFTTQTKLKVKRVTIGNLDGGDVLFTGFYVVGI